MNIGYDASFRPQIGHNGEVRFASNHRFSEKIIKQGGLQRDTTIMAASKAVKRVKLVQDKLTRPLEQLEQTFQKNASAIHDLSNEIDTMKQTMALRLAQWYAALSIQCMVRRCRAKTLYRRKRAIRLLCLFIYFKSFFRRRQAAVFKIMNAYQQYRRRRAFTIVMRLHRNAKKIQRWYKQAHSRHVMFSKLTFVQTVKRTFDHTMLFGVRRAFRAIMMERNPDYYAIRAHPLVTFMLKCTRKRRLRFLNGPQGKTAFYVLAHYCDGYASGKSNPVIAYIRRRLGKERRNSTAGNALINTLVPNEINPVNDSDSKGNNESYSPPPPAVSEDRSNGGTSNNSSPVRASISATSISRYGKKGNSVNNASGVSMNSPTNSGSYSRNTSPNNRRSRGAIINILPGTSLGALTSSKEFSINDLPPIMKGFYRIRTFADAVVLIRDLTRLARLNPSFLDDYTPPAAKAAAPVPNRRVKAPNRDSVDSVSTTKSITGRRDVSPNKSSLGGGNSRMQTSVLNSALAAAVAAVNGAGDGVNDSTSTTTSTSAVAAKLTAKPPTQGDPSQSAPRNNSTKVRRTTSKTNSSKESSSNKSKNLSSEETSIGANDNDSIGGDSATSATSSSSTNNPKRPTATTTTSQTSSITTAARIGEVSTRQSSIGKSPRTTKLLQQHVPASSTGSSSHKPAAANSTNTNTSTNNEADARRNSVSSVISALSEDDNRSVHSTASAASNISSSAVRRNINPAASSKTNSSSSTKPSKPRASINSRNNSNRSTSNNGDDNTSVNSEMSAAKVTRKTIVKSESSPIENESLLLPTIVSINQTANISSSPELGVAVDVPMPISTSTSGPANFVASTETIALVIPLETEHKLEQILKIASTDHTSNETSESGSKTEEKQKLPEIRFGAAAATATRQSEARLEALISHFSRSNSNRVSSKPNSQENSQENSRQSSWMAPAAAPVIVETPVSISSTAKTIATTSSTLAEMLQYQQKVNKQRELEEERKAILRASTARRISADMAGNILYNAASSAAMHAATSSSSSNSIPSPPKVAAITITDDPSQDLAISISTTVDGTSYSDNSTTKMMMSTTSTTFAADASFISQSSPFPMLHHTLGSTTDSNSSATGLDSSPLPISSLQSPSSVPAITSNPRNKHIISKHDENSSSTSIVSPSDKEGEMNIEKMDDTRGQMENVQLSNSFFLSPADSMNSLNFDIPEEDMHALLLAGETSFEYFPISPSHQHENPTSSAKKDTTSKIVSDVDIADDELENTADHFAALAEQSSLSASLFSPLSATKTHDMSSSKSSEVELGLHASSSTDKYVSKNEGEVDDEDTDLRPLSAMSDLTA